MKNRILASLFVMACLGSPAQAQQGQLAAARDLYASARYDEALSLLNGLPGGDSPDRKSIEQYRSLCLLALGRGSEAESAIAAVVTVDPLFVPGEAEASPRVRAAFSEVRHRLLPEIAASRYGVAKAAFDRKAYDVSEPRFRELLTLLDDPQMGTRLADLRVLAKGFLDLSVAAAAPPPPPAKAEPALPAPAPAAAVAADHIWTADEPGVIAATPLKQVVPRVPVAISGKTRDRGLLEVIIDEQGRVIGVTLRTSIHPAYDALLMSAARQWKYQPATVNGAPVRFRKLIQIVVDRT
ncbi:MAG: energy transducer TonB [Acidobacteriota bacterium]|nr:energy transducer TonB [Acidobacteriota bacterium]